MKSCKTSIARQMGYLSHPSVEEDVHGGTIHVLGPSSGKMTSYHQGLSNKTMYLNCRSAFTVLMQKKRSKRNGGRTVLFAR